MHPLNKIILVVMIFDISQGLRQNDEQTSLFQYYDVERPKTLLITTNASPLSNPDKSEEYRNFLAQLYRFDADKTPATFQVVSNQQRAHEEIPQLLGYKPYSQHRLVKRASDDINHDTRTLVSRPVFVYSQRVVRYKRLTREEYRKKYLQHFRY